MALGIGISTTLFGGVNPWLFRPLPYPRSVRLVGLRETEPERGDRSGRTSGVSGPNYLDWRERSRSFAGMGACDRTQVNLSAGDVPERIHAAPRHLDVLPHAPDPARARARLHGGRRPSAGPARRAHQPGESVLGSGY